MQAPDRSECEGKSVRRPLYGSVWLALFALLGEEWAKLGNGPIELQKRRPPTRKSVRARGLLVMIVFLAGRNRQVQAVLLRG